MSVTGNPPAHPDGPTDRPRHKAELRRRILAQRDAMSTAVRRRLSDAIFASIAVQPAFGTARVVLAYCSFGSEPVTDGFLRQVLAFGKTLALPRVDRAARRLDLHRVERPETELAPGILGIREPDPARCSGLDPGAVEFVLVPGVAFDVRGGRVGYGGGYYDRLLSTLEAGVTLVAGAFELQVVPEVPMGPHDRRVDRVVTEQRVYPSEFPTARGG